jgi:hypothetical protein
VLELFGVSENRSGLKREPNQKFPAVGDAKKDSVGHLA